MHLELETVTSNVFEVLSEIEQGFEGIVDVVEKYQDQIPEYEIGEDYDRFKDPSIYGVIAHRIYEYLEQLATAQRHDDWIRSHAIGVWLRIFGVASSPQSKAAIEIGKRLIIHLNKKIDENLDLERRWYPVITRLLLSLNGIHEITDRQDLTPRDSFQRMFIQRIKRDYPKLVIRDPEFAKRLLPEHFLYDSTKNEIRHERRRREEEVVLKLEPTGG